MEKEMFVPMMANKEGKTVLSFSDDIGFTQFRVNSDWLVEQKKTHPNISNVELFNKAIVDDNSDVDY